MEIKENEEMNIWIIRFSDGQMMSFLGSKKEAEEYARKESGNRRYVIN